ncbi:MAG: epoxyqueuosine reductase QueH, partial [Treponema sp.]|nr:epoxyqueuosine reductase QueH [Treponema sp.]
IHIKEHPELATEKEKGIRCYNCYEFRLKKAFEYAINNNFDWFTTTLSISPFKDAEKINDIGKKLEQTISKINSSCKLKFLTSDFKKKGGFKRSLEISSEYDLYRQQYCGCVYSMNNSSK